MDDGLAVTTWNDQAPVIGFQVKAFNWRLRRAREAKGWSRAELARQAGVSGTTVGDAEMLQRISPVSRWKIALTLGVPEDVLFPGEIDALPAAGPPTIEFSMTREDIQSVDTTEHAELRSDLVEQLDTLPPRIRSVIMWRFGLVDGQARTLEETAEQFGVTRERIRQIESRGLRLLRHSKRSRPLRAYLHPPSVPYQTRPTPKPDECQYWPDRANEEPCWWAFRLPGWMHEREPRELRRPSFWCAVCWDRYLDARARESFEKYLAL